MPSAAEIEDVLRQRTRSRLVDALRVLKRPATTAELAAVVELHRTGVRAHLERLEDAGLVERRRERQGRGRPRDVWSVAPDTALGQPPPSAYAELATWLAGAIEADEDNLRDVEAAGTAVGRRLAAEGPPLPLADRLEASFAALGFKPRLTVRQGGRLSLELGSCPYRVAARANQPIVCALHRGLTRGMLETSRAPASLRTFTPRDPDTAGCFIEIEIADA